jgi:hypothetical protein
MSVKPRPALSFAQWKAGFDGFSMRGCAVRERGFYYFALEALPAGSRASAKRKDPRGAVTHLGILYEKDAAEPWSFDALYGFSSPQLAVAMHPKPHALMSGGLQGVYAAGSGYDGLEQPLPHMRPHRLRVIDGVMYAVGYKRRVFRREGPARWTLMSQGPGFEEPQGDDAIERAGFKDISGFSASDVYAVGGKGDVWHYSGSAWRRCAFPSTHYLETVLCAGDGKVYVTGQSGSVFVGAGDSWTQTEEGSFSGYFNDCVWFAGKVWLAHDSGLYVLNPKGEVIGVQLPPELHVTTGHLAVGDGVLLSAGLGGASVFDGKQWQILVNHFEMREHTR